MMLNDYSQIILFLILPVPFLYVRDIASLFDKSRPYDW